MEQIFKEVREYIAQNKNEYGPPVKFDFSKIDYGIVMENFLQKNKVPYFIFSEKQYFLKHELIHISIDQITNRDLKYNLAGRQNMVHQHEFFELFYVYSGKCISTIDEVPVEFHQGDIGLYSPKAIHSMRTPDDGDVVINILIRKKLFEQTFLSMVDNNDLITGFFMDALYNPNSNQKHVVFKKEQTTIAPMIVIQMLYEYKKNDSFSQDILASYFSCLLSDLARSYTHKLSRTILPEYK